MNMIPDTPSAVSLFVLGYSTKLQNCFHPAREDVLHTMLTNHIWCCHIAILHLFCPQNMLVRSWFYVFSYLYLRSTASPTLFFGSCWRRSHVVFLSALCCVLVRSTVAVAEDHMPPSSLAKQFQNPPDIWSMTEKVVVECSTDRCLKHINNAI